MTRIVLDPLRKPTKIKPLFPPAFDNSNIDLPIIHWSFFDIIKLMRRRLYQIAVILASLFIIQGLSRGLIELSAQDRRVGKAKQELAKLTEQERELRKQLEYFQSDEYVEKIARDKLLLAKPGETVLLLPKEEKNSDLRSSSFGLRPLPSETDLPNWQKWAKLFGF